MCRLPELLLGVVGTAPEVTRLVRAVSGVGALIKDFFGVSVMDLLLRLLVKLAEAELRSVLDEDAGGCGLRILVARLPPVMYG